jgi:hypothetical protein
MQAPTALSHPQLPQCWEMLSRDDQSQYTKLRDYLAIPGFSNRRNHSMDQFQLTLDLVKHYVVRGDSDDRIRGYVCGMIWMDGGQAINTQHLSFLTAKCKSAINGSFSRLGYETVPAGNDASSELIENFPFLRDNFGQLRHWTIRRRIEEDSAPGAIRTVMPMLSHSTNRVVCRSRIRQT